jgi:D-ribose pyranase
MLKSGILNPDISSLLCRVRHTNTLVIADRGFPYWPMIETVDISLVDDIPTVLQVFLAIRPNFVVGQICMAQEFLDHNIPAIQQQFHDAFAGIPVTTNSMTNLRSEFLMRSVLFARLTLSSMPT